MPETSEYLKYRHNGVLTSISILTVTSFIPTIFSPLQLLTRDPSHQVLQGISIGLDNWSLQYSI
jgi:hypothetical protein